MSSTSGVSFTGLASGINTTALIQNVLRFDQQRISNLQTQEAGYQSSQSAFTTIQSDLQTLQSAASQLGQSQSSVFDSMTATSSNSSVLSVAAGTGAQPGITSLQVLAVAQSSQLASQGYSDENAQITQGTFQISAGSQTASITIDSTNNTLSGLEQAINNANIGVSASIVDTGSGNSASQPYRLLLTSNNTGTANAIKITNSLGADSNGAVQPNFGSSVIGPAVTGSTYTGTSSVTANSGTGNYTGSANDTYTFTVVNGGTVGTDNNIEVQYTNTSGTETGTLTLNSADVNTPQTVADGVQVTFGSGTLNQGDQFSVSVFSPVVQAASNAQIQIGSGAGAVTIQNSSNTFTGLIPGVTLSVQSANPGQTIQVNVASDTSTIASAITNFVDDYNKFASDLATDTAYTPTASGSTTGTAGPLNGNTALISIQNQIEQQILGVSSNLPTEMNRLSALGITPDSTGQLQINTTTLNSALSGGISGVTIDDIKNLFSLQGQSSSPNVQFSTGTSKTVAGTYTVNVTQAATQASVSGTNQLASSTVIDSSNNTLSFTLNGQTTGTITLASGTYTAQALADEVQTEINSAAASNGGSVSVSLNNNQLVLTSTLYGATSNISGLSGTAVSALGYTGSESSTGQNVAGSFTINGVTEAATGVGQILTGSSSNTYSSGLSVVVLDTPTQVGSGTSSTLTVTSGLASTLNNTLNSLLDPVNGQMTQIGSQISQEITNVQSDITTATTQMDAEQSQLTSEFAAMEATLENLQQTSSLITNELANANSSSGSSSSSTTQSAVSNGLSNSQITTTTSS